MSLPTTLQEWQFSEPLALWALALTLLPWIASWRKKRLAWPTIHGFQGVSTIRARLLRFLPDACMSLSIALIVLALARPQAVGGQTRIAAKGVGIVVAIDRSASMNATDYHAEGEKPESRLDAAKSTLIDFIEGRSDDLLGVIAFANVPRRVAPPTLDHSFVVDAVRAIRPARSGEGGTNLGHAIAFGLGELQDLSAPRKVLVLITDGHDSPTVSDTIQPISPEEAATLARGLGIRIHTIAIGGKPKSVSIENLQKQPIAEPGPDLPRLELIAKLGGGKAFAASDTKSLGDIFKEIDSLEKSPFQGTIRTRYREGYPYLVGVALVCLTVERFLRCGPFRVL